MLVKCFSGTQKWPSFEAAITDQVDDEGEVECNDNGYDEVDVPKRRHLLYVDSYEVHVDGNDSYSQDADYCLHYPESSIINAKYITRLYICAHNTSFWDKFCLGFLWGFFLVAQNGKDELMGHVHKLFIDRDIYTPHSFFSFNEPNNLIRSELILSPIYNQWSGLESPRI